MPVIILIRHAIYKCDHGTGGVSALNVGDIIALDTDDGLLYF